MIYKLPELSSHDLRELMNKRGLQLGDKVTVSVPRRKGVRNLVKGRIQLCTSNCGCCSPYLYLEKGS